MNKDRVRWHVEGLQVCKAGVQDAIVHLRDLGSPSASAEAMRLTAARLLALADRLDPPVPVRTPAGGMANRTEREFTQTVISLLNGLANMPDELGAVLGAEMGLEEEAACAESLRGMEAASFQDEGVMSSNEGLTVRLPNGRRFQLTVVMSR